MTHFWWKFFSCKIYFATQNGKIKLFLDIFLDEIKLPWTPFLHKILSGHFYDSTFLNSRKLKKKV